MARRALVAGAGIGGLTAALALARAGFEVEIFEREPKLAEFGAGLQLGPNATRVLQRLGALEAVRGLAVAPRAIRVLRGLDGGEIARLPIGDAERRWGAPYLVIHRADLHRALAEAAMRLPNVALRLGTEVAEVEADGAGVAVGLQRGGVATRRAGDVLVGADGLRSRTRERIGLGAADAATFSGRVAFRAMVDAQRIAPRWSAGEVTLRLGAKAHLVHYPVRGGSLVNLVAAIESGWRGEDGDPPWDALADRPALDRAFADWSRDARALIAAAVEWRAWPLYVRPPIACFSLGRVALIGDAAHPMTPFLAQGAAQAIEDAGALARRLADAGDVTIALAAYSADRVARASRIQRDALAQGRIYHLSGPLAFARDVAIGVLGPRRLLDRYDWLYAA
ncbi:MAG: FAD-dependent monooxygenase [Roseiarcus sp.]|jgi:salicylate hydroxylase